MYVKDRVLDPIRIKLPNDTYSIELHPVAEVYRKDDGEIVQEAAHAWFAVKSDAEWFAKQATEGNGP